MCARARAFRVNTFTLIYRCSLLYIHCCLLNIMRLTPDPVLIFVTLSWLRFLTLSLVHVMQCKWAFYSLSLLNGIYVSTGIQIHYLTIPKPWAGQNVDQTSASGLYDGKDQYNAHTPCAIVVVCSGLTSLSTIFQSYYDGVWLRQGAQCSLLLCCVTEVSCLRHLTWYHTQSHYPDTASTSPIFST